MRRRTRIGIISGCVALGLTGVVVCSYGHAAVTTSLVVNGEATALNMRPKFGVTYMQDMTAEICEAAEIGTSEQLIDKRDNKKYWVGKLKDNNCWMTQNLALDITTAGLTSELSDLNPSINANYESTVVNGQTILKWTSKSKYPPQNTVVGPFSITDTSADYTAAKSSKLDADYVYAIPTQAIATSDGEKVTSISQLTTARLQNVTGWADTYEYNSKTSGFSVDTDRRTYDAHYLMGNYYTNGAATAGSGVAVNNSPSLVHAPSSICPRGWTLPTGSGDSSQIGSLVSLYGFSLSTTVQSGKTTRAISEPPLYLYRAGNVSVGSLFINIGVNGFYLTGSAVPNLKSWYNFVIRGRDVEIVNASVRTAGRSVRCVLRKSTE